MRVPSSSRIFLFWASQSSQWTSRCWILEPNSAAHLQLEALGRTRADRAQPTTRACSRADDPQTGHNGRGESGQGKSKSVTSRPGCMVGLCLTRLSSFSRCPGWLTRTLARAPFAVWPCATALHGCSALSCACALLRASPANQTTLRHTPLYASSALRDVDMRASPPPSSPLLATQPRRPLT